MKNIAGVLALLAFISVANCKHTHNVSTTISSPSSDASPQPKCASGWISFKDSCYYISQKTLPWAQARIHCSTKAATLFVVNSDLEWDRISRHAVRAMWNWIGLTASRRDIMHPVWEAPSDLNVDKSLPWLNKLPGHGAVPGVSCAAYYAAPDPTYAYTNYYDCNIRNYYICERNFSLPRIEPIVGRR